MHKKAMEMAKYAIDDACTKGYDNMTSQDWDDFKDCMEVAEKAIKADYYYHIVEAMEEANKEDEEEAKYMLKMLKDEYKDEYKHYRDEYGEDADKRFYDAWRYKSSGRFAPKGKGTRYGRRSYTEPPYYHMTPEMMKYDPEHWRDVDRENGRLYYTPVIGNSGMDNDGGKTYSDGVNDGTRRGYSDGYEKGMRDGERNNSSRYEIAKRGYEEVKQAHKSNTPEDKQLTMKETEKMLNVVFDEIDEMLEGASPEVKSLVKTKGMARFQKIQ